MNSNCIFATKSGWLMLAEHAEPAPDGTKRVTLRDTGEVKLVDGLDSQTFDSTDAAEEWITMESSYGM
jgi:hypothetical protein